MDWREIKRCQGRRRRHRVTVSGCDVAAAYLTEPRSSGITGQVITVDGGIFTTWHL